MKWGSFIQSMIFFILFVLSIISFKTFNLDVNFMVTFILAIFTISISVFFFTESNKLSSKIDKKITVLKEKVEESINQNPEKVKDLSISNDNIYSRKRKGGSNGRKTNRF